MFIGHFGAGLGAKKINNVPSLGTMFIAAQFLDILWPVLLLLGVEKAAVVPKGPPFLNLEFIYYPYTHSLIGALTWSVLFGLVYYAIKKNKSGAVLLGCLVLSHWVLDLIVHVPDLPIFPWSNIKVGFGLWHSPVVTIIIESLIYIGGAFLYMKTRKEQNKKKLVGSVSLIVVLYLIYLMSAFSAAPPSINMVGYSALGLWLFVAWAYWVDRKPKAAK